MKTTGQYEHKDVDVVSLSLIVFALLICLALIALIVGGMMHYLSRREPAATARMADFPAPRLEVRPGTSLTEFRAAEDVDLTSYGWIDRDNGIVRIPIARAMQLLVERGLPDVGAGQTPLSLMQTRPNESATPPRLPSKP